MADLSDVENKLVEILSGILYPAGIPGGVNPPSPVAACPVICYPGWPQSATLDADLAIGKAHVSVFTLDAERNTTRYPKDWQTVTDAAPTVTAIIGAQAITIGGTVTIPQNVAIEINGLCFVYGVQAGNTLTAIAAALAALIAVSVPGTTNTGPVINVPVAGRISAARVGAQGVGIMETRRQERLFQITVWASTPDLRTAVSKPIDAALSNIERFTLVDQTSARLIYKGSPVTDKGQIQGVYRRDFLYTVEYATTITEVETQISVEQINLSAKIDGATASTVVAQINL